MNITNEVINEIRNKIDIIEVVSNYVPLTQRGKNYFGVCPFHDDHSPSMSVSKERQLYKCFVCNKGGNVLVCGTPEDVASCDKSYTGLFLKKVL